MYRTRVIVATLMVAAGIVAAAPAATAGSSAAVRATALRCGDNVTDQRIGSLTLRKLVYYNCATTTVSRIATSYDSASCTTIPAGESRTLAHVNRAYYPFVGASAPC